jgi:hypothetical protein
VKPGDHAFDDFAGRKLQLADAGGVGWGEVFVTMDGHKKFNFHRDGQARQKRS